MTVKGLYKRHELPAHVADYLMSCQESLRDDFMRGFSTLEEAAKAQAVDTMDRRELGIPAYKTEWIIQTENKETGEFEPNFAGWKNMGFRYERHDDEVDVSFTADFSMKYLAAHKIIRKYGGLEKCPIANYSILAPNSVIQRHTGVENREGKYVRIHIPLIIPKGDVFFECNGEEIDWSDIWGFNNQLPHSAHNLTDEYRLVFLLDLEREAIGMSPGEPYDPSIEQNATPFKRNKK
jgi:hypothetical protein